MIVIRNQQELEAYILRHLDTILPEFSSTRRTHAKTITEAFEALTRWKKMGNREREAVNEFLSNSQEPACKGCTEPMPKHCPQGPADDGYCDDCDWARTNQW